MPIKNYSFTILFLKYSGRYIALLKDVACFNFKLARGMVANAPAFSIKAKLEAIVLLAGSTKSQKKYIVSVHLTHVFL